MKYITELQLWPFHKGNCFISCKTHLNSINAWLHFWFDFLMFSYTWLNAVGIVINNNIAKVKWNMIKKNFLMSFTKFDLASDFISMFFFFYQKQNSHSRKSLHTLLYNKRDWLLNLLYSQHSMELNSEVYLVWSHDTNCLEVHVNVIFCSRNDGQRKKSQPTSSGNTS